MGSEGRPGKRARILIVEDTPALLRLFARALDPYHDVTGALDPTVAVQAIESGARFDVILCDILMPTLSGIDVYARVERVDTEQARRIVFLTGDVFAPGVQEFLERTGSLHLQKPITPSALLELVRSIVG